MKKILGLFFVLLLISSCKYREYKASYSIVEDDAVFNKKSDTIFKDSLYIPQNTIKK